MVISEKKIVDLKPKQPTFFKINEFITLKLEGGRTNIYVKGQLFNQCKYLLLNINTKKARDYDEIGSIDEAIETLNRGMEGGGANRFEITPETEFWGHCSNIQAWAENNYDTRILHRNLSFPLLKRLASLDDLKAKRVFREEVAMRLESGYPSVIAFLSYGGYLNVITDDEFKIIVETSKMLENLISYLSVSSIGTNYYIRNILRKAERLSGNFVAEKMIGFLQSNDLRTFRGLSRLGYFNTMSRKMKSELLNDPESVLHEFIVEVNGREYFLAHDLSLKLMKKGLKDMREIKGIRRLKQIRTLDLRHNFITDIHGLENCTNLKKLKLKGNPIPENILNLLGGVNKYGNARKPQKFVEYCQDRELDELPIVKVNKQYFDAVNGRLNLRYLGIKNLSEIKGLERVKDIEFLDLSNNNFTDVKGIEQFAALKELNLQHNQLMDLSGLEKLENLEVLRLFGNEIYEAPEVESLKNLKKVFFDSTRKLDNKVFLKYLLNSLTVKEMATFCRDNQVEGYSRLMRHQLITHIPNYIEEEKLIETADELEPKIVLKNIKKAIQLISAKSRNVVREIDILDENKHEFEINFKYPKKMEKIKVSFNKENLVDPERNCNCKVGLFKGYCEHFWIGFIVALKLGYFKLEDWKTTMLPKDFEKSISTMKLIDYRESKTIRVG